MDRLQVCLLLVLLAVAICAAHKHKNPDKHHGHHRNKHHNKHHGHHKSEHPDEYKTKEVHAKHPHSQHKSLVNEACVKRPFEGCNINNRECVCSETNKPVWACKNPFHYKNSHQCKKDQRGDLNKCRRHPCKNGGECVQIKHNKWACSCAGTGFYGKTCSYNCESDNLVGENQKYRSACVF